MSQDFYEILWLQKGASEDDIKKAYRKLAMEYHPDRNQGDKEAEAKFKEVNQAYATLSDRAKRQQYDMFGTAWSSWWNPFWWSWFQAEDLGDIFSSFFWWGFWWSARKTPRETPWEDLEHDLRVDLKTSIYGWKETITFYKREHCSLCNGEWWSGKKECHTCKWRGQVIYTSQSPFWVIQQTRTCPDCQGSWEVFESICSDCQGEKRRLIKKNLDIDIPAGIDEGMIIKLQWEGNDGVGTKAAGDLYIHFSVEREEKWLTRDGTDLHYDIEVDVVEAVLGTQKDIHIPIIGKRSVSISPGTQAESIMKISWDGVKHVNKDTKGDLLIHIHIPIPTKLSKKQRELFEEMAKEKKLNVCSKKGVFEKLFG